MNNIILLFHLLFYDNSCVIGGSSTWEAGELLQLQGQSDLHNEFQGSMGYREKACLEKIKLHKEKNRKK